MDKGFENTLRDHIVPIKGDIVQEKFGMSEADYQMVTSDVNIIINNAASVQFNDRLDIAIKSNTISTLNLINLAKDCKNLIILTHVSTAYVNCNKPGGFIEEKIYEDDITYDVE